MRGPALTCDAVGPVMVLRMYRILSALGSGGEVRLACSGVIRVRKKYTPGASPHRCRAIHRAG